MENKSVEQTEKREVWGSKSGYILSTIGMAFGLGAIWRFPYVAAENGGGAFVLAFTLATIFIAVPAGWAEIAFAKKMRTSPVVAFEKVLGKKGRYIAWIFPFIPLGLCMYYLVVVAWTLAYTFFSFSSPGMLSEPKVFYHDFIADKTTIFMWTLATLVIISFVCYKGIKGGIEKFSKFCIPLHYIILFILLFIILRLPNIEAGITLFAKPDWAKLLEPGIWVRAVGMALFAIGLGPAFLMAYGSYLPEKADVTSDFLTVAWWNLLGCIASGFVVVPAVVAYGLDLQSGPGLTFMTLPHVFAELPFPRLIAFAFFFSMLLGGFSAAIGIMENSVTTFSDGLGWSRKKTVIAVTVAVAVGSIPCIWSDQFLAIFDYIIGDFGYTLTASIMAIILAWVVGAEKIRTEWLNPTSSIKLGKWFVFVYKYLVVGFLLYLLVQSLILLPKILAAANIVN